jgi:hypothetical protein
MKPEQWYRGCIPLTGGMGGVPPQFLTKEAEQTDRDAQPDAPRA